MTAKKTLIEVALPLDAINKRSTPHKSVRHGHPYLRSASRAPTANSDPPNCGVTGVNYNLNPLPRWTREPS